MFLSSRPAYQVVLEVGFVSLLAISSIVLNILACVNIWQSPLLRTWHNIFTINLIVIDLLTSVFSMTFTIIILAYGEWPMRSSICNLSGYINAVLAAIAIITLALFSFSRYQLFAHPQSYLTIWNRKRCLQAIATVWTLASLASLPPVFGWGKYKFLERNAVCFLSFTDNTAYSSIYVYGLLAFPLIFSVVYLVRLYIAIRTRRRLNCQNPEVETNIEFRQTIRAAKTLLILALAFIICWLPVFIVYALDATSNVYLSRGLCLFSTLMIYVFGVILPLIYNATSSVFTIGCCSGCFRKLRLQKTSRSTVQPGVEDNQ